MPSPARRTALLAGAVLAGLLLPAAPGAASPPAATAPTVQAQAAGAVLRPGQSLPGGGAVVSPNGRIALQQVTLPDGVVDVAIVNPATRFGRTYVLETPFDCPASPCGLEFRPDGVLLLTTADGPQEVDPDRRAAERLALADDGSLTLERGDEVLRRLTRYEARRELRRGGTLLPGESLLAGLSSLAMQRDGNLVLYGPQQGVAWSSGTGVPGSALVFQDDGNAVVYSPDRRPLFDTRTAGSLTLPEGEADPRTGVLRLVEGERPVLEVVPDARPGAPAPAPVFSTAGTSTLRASQTLFTGGRLTSPSGRVVTVLQGDGNLVTYRDGRAVFASRTRGATVAVMQGDGNLVLYREERGPTGQVTRLTALWSTRTGGNPGARVVTQDDGNLVVYSPADRPLFSAL